MNNMRTNNVDSKLLVLLVLVASGCAVAPDQSAGAPGEEVVARTRPPRGVPNTPAVFEATIASNTAVRLNWTAVTNQTEFHLDRGESVDCGDGSGPNCVQFVTFPPIAANALTFTDTTVHLNGSYTWRLQACNLAGCSEHAYADAFLQ